MPARGEDVARGPRYRSRDEFKVAPFIRVLDVYIWGLEVADVRRIRAALDGLVAFVNSRRMPEPDLPPAQLA